MNNRLISLIAMLGLLLILGCERSELRRTSTNGWERRTFRDEGLSLAIPAASKVDHHPSFGVSVEMHPLAPPWFRLQDTHYFMTIHAERKTGQLVRDEREALDQHVEQTQENEFQFWSADEHPLIDVRRGDHYSHYRYDVKCAGGDIVQLRGEVRHPMVNGAPRFQSEDDAVVRRILTSAECLAP